MQAPAEQPRSATESSTASIREAAGDVVNLSCVNNARALSLSWMFASRSWASNLASVPEAAGGYDSS